MNINITGYRRLCGGYFCSIPAVSWYESPWTEYQRNMFRVCIALAYGRAPLCTSISIFLSICTCTGNKMLAAARQRYLLLRSRLIWAPWVKCLPFQWTKKRLRATMDPEICGDPTKTCWTFNGILAGEAWKNEQHAFQFIKGSHTQKGLESWGKSWKCPNDVGSLWCFALQF